jgi:hypothetical protein
VIFIRLNIVVLDGIEFRNPEYKKSILQITKRQYISFPLFRKIQ